jgi:hypothetical protein
MNNIKNIKIRLSKYQVELINGSSAIRGLQVKIGVNDLSIKEAQATQDVLGHELVNGLIGGQAGRRIEDKTYEIMVAIKKAKQEISM